MSPHAEAPAQVMRPGCNPTAKDEHKVVVPAEVKEAWAAVKLVVNDKKTNKQQDVTVDIGEELTVLIQI